MMSLVDEDIQNKPEKFTKFKIKRPECCNKCGM